MSDSDYPWEVIPDPSGGYTIRFPDLPGCMTCVETLYHIGNVAAEIRDLWLETAREAGMAIPEPGSYEADYRRLRELEQAVRAILMPMDVGNETHWYLRGYIKRAKRDAIGRLLEGEPTIEDIGGSDPDFTGGKRTEDYVREMREGGRE